MCLLNADYLNSNVGSAKNLFSVLADNSVSSPPASKPDPTGASQETPPKRSVAQSGPVNTPNCPIRDPQWRPPCCPLLPTPLRWPQRRSLLPLRLQRQPPMSSQSSLNSPRWKSSRSRVVATTGLPLSKSDPFMVHTTGEFFDPIMQAACFERGGSLQSLPPCFNYHPQRPRSSTSYPVSQSHQLFSLKMVSILFSVPLRSASPLHTLSFSISFS